jgi:hypothetical protein
MTWADSLLKHKEKGNRSEVWLKGKAKDHEFTTTLLGNSTGGWTMDTTSSLTPYVQHYEKLRQYEQQLYPAQSFPYSTL